MQISLALCLSLFFLSGYAQNQFSMGTKIGYGTSAFPMDVFVESGSSVTVAKSGATLTTGVIGRYTIGDRIGIESGVSLNHYSFYEKNNFRRHHPFWKSGAEFEIVDVQMPVILNYKMRLLRHPFRYIIASAGTSIDWLVPFVHRGTAFPIRPGTFQNIVGSLKVGRDRPKGNKLEIGIEIQYSVKEFQIAHFRDDGLDYNVYARLNMVALNVSYFFMNHERMKESI